MEIVNLPNDIIPGATMMAEPVIIHEYTAERDRLKGRSILHTNAISLVMSGSKTMHFADKTVHVNEDEFHFLSTGNCLASVNLSPDKPFRSILVFFDNATLANFHLKYGKQIEQAGGQPKRQEPYIAFKKDAFARNFIDSLALMLHSAGGFSTAMKILKFEELMLHLLEHEPQKILSFYSNKLTDFDDLHIRKAVETNILNNISVEEMAFLCNMSVSTFKRKFAKIYGTTPGKWMVQKRMEVARNLLLHHNEKPAEVYHKVGYENHSSFSQAFRQVYGMSPREYQQQQLNVYP